MKVLLITPTLFVFILKMLAISGIVAYAYEQPPLLNLLGYSLLVFVLVAFALRLSLGRLPVGF